MYCLSRAAQLPSWGLAVSLVSLPQTCCFYRRHTCATSAFCASEAVHRKVCWLTCCVRKDCRLNTDLRFALVSELAHVPGPTDTYGPHCTMSNTFMIQIHHRKCSPSGKLSTRIATCDPAYHRALTTDPHICSPDYSRIHSETRSRGNVCEQELRNHA